MHTKIAVAAVISTTLVALTSSFAHSAERDQALAPGNSWAPLPQERIVGTDTDPNVRLQIRRDPSNDR